MPGFGSDELVSIYRPTPDEQKLFMAIRTHIEGNRKNFREAGEWLETEYTIEEIDRREREGKPTYPADYKAVHEARERWYEENGFVTCPLQETSKPFVRLLRSAQDLLEEKPDVTNMVRVVRGKISRRILFVTWLITDPDAAELGLGFTTLEKMPWNTNCEVLDRSMIRDEIIPRGWMQLVKPVWTMFQEESKHVGSEGGDDVKPGMPRQEAKKKAEKHVKANGGIFPGRNALAKLVGCSRGTMTKAIGKSKYLMARQAEADALKKPGGREVSLSDGISAGLEQDRESDPTQEILEDLVAEQEADSRREDRQHQARKRSH